MIEHCPAGKMFIPQVDGWFVPNARMLEIMNKLDSSRILEYGE